MELCLSAIASKIPLRNALPALVEAASAELASGNMVACLCQAVNLSDICTILGRTTIVQNLNSLILFATLMDYRRVFGDQTAEGDDLDSAVSEAVVELCLKLTENELKQFLNHCIEWTRRSSIRRLRRTTGESSRAA